MFERAAAEVTASVYGVIGHSNLGNERLTASTGTAFLVAPGLLATAAHVLHRQNDRSAPLHDTLVAFRAPELGKRLSPLRVVAVSDAYDLALLALPAPAEAAPLALRRDVVPIGTPCGALGYPLSTVTFPGGNMNVNMVLRFQSAYLSTHDGRYYETDAPMYAGSSGCPGFLPDATVFGVQFATRTQVDLVPGTQDAGLSRLAIAVWISSAAVIEFAAANGVVLPRQVGSGS